MEGGGWGVAVLGGVGREGRERERPFTHSAAPSVTRAEVLTSISPSFEQFGVSFLYKCNLFPSKLSPFLNWKFEEDLRGVKSCRGTWQSESTAQNTIRPSTKTLNQIPSAAEDYMMALQLILLSYSNHEN